MRLGLSSNSFQHSLVVTGEEPIPVELLHGRRFERDMITTHEKADVIIVQQEVQLLKSDTKTICVISDDTDVFVLLVHFYVYDQENPL